jgi:hypothetical protein
MRVRFDEPLDMTAGSLLDERIPLRVSVQTAKGPLIAPLCAFDLSTNDMPYRGLRGRGNARCLPERGVAVLERLIDRYLPNRHTPLAAWLLSRSADEVAIEITPTWQTTWDYSARMSDPG